METCKYGCGQEGLYQFKDGTWCCSKNVSLCPEIKKKISLKNDIEICIKNLPSPESNPANKKHECIFCKKLYSWSKLKIHESSCYLNPKNIKLCPICNEPVKYYKGRTTCSNKCANKFFKKMYSEFGGQGKRSTFTEYTKACFTNHKKECIVCREDKMVAVHHYDGDQSNNSPENVLPLCPTHHQYMHSGFKELITEKVERYREEWIKNKTFKGVA